MSEIANKKSPLVSIIIPTYNSERTLEKCLLHVQRQTYDPIELIVVDNHSTDKTPEIVRRFADEFISQDGGMGVQVNRGVEASSGKCIAYFDDDMYLSPNIIESCVDVFKDGSDAIIIPEDTLHTSFWGEVRDAEKQYYKGNDDIQAARFFRRSAFLEVSGINENLRGYEDYDIHQKVKQAGYSVGRIDVTLEHDVNPQLRTVLTKRYRRSNSFFVYSENHPSHANSIIFRSELLVGVVRLLKSSPLLGIGLLILKAGEYLATGAGLVRHKLVSK